MRPYVSFIVYTRNDDYAGGVAKCAWGVRYLAEQCDEFGLDAELVLVEWNPPTDRAPLVDALGPIPRSERLTIRVVTVPPIVHMAFENAHARAVHPAVAANVGIRRARGEFRVCKAADSYYSDALIRELSHRTLEAGNLYRVERWDVDPAMEQSLGSSRRDFLLRCSTSVVARHEHLPQAWTPFSLPDLFCNAAGDFQLLAAEDWASLRGNTETRDTVAFEIDSLLAYSAYALGIRERRLTAEAIVYKIAHESSHVHRLTGDSGWFTGRMLRLEDMTKRIPLRRVRDFCLRALLNYPRKLYGGLRKPAYERSLIRYKLLSALPQLNRLKNTDWGLAAMRLPEGTVCQAAWDRATAP